MSLKKSFFAIVSLILSTLACILTSTSSAPNTTSEVTSIPEYFESVDCLSFGGKVINKDTGNWVNNRLILLFLKGDEIARTTTSMREIRVVVPILEGGSPWAFEGESVANIKGNYSVEDGLFLVSAPNLYKLTISTLGTSSEESSFFEGKIYPSDLDEKECSHVLISWLYPFYEGDIKEFFIPSKNIRYAIKVLSGDMSQLPSEIQQPGSVRLLEGNRLAAINPNELQPSTQVSSSNPTRFEKIIENIDELSRSVFPINNCGGVSDIKQEITQTYIHEIIDETSGKLGFEIPILDWLKIVAEVEHKYGINDKEITTYSTTLTVPAGKNIEYTVLRKQVWESGTAVSENNGVEISAAYRILKNEIFEVANSEQKSCP